MKHIRNTGRNLKRWGTRHGFRAGTSDADKARILAARIVHIVFWPRTRTPEDFRDEYGRGWSGGTVETRTAEAQPYTIGLLLSLYDDALRELANGHSNPGSTDPDEAAGVRAYDSLALLTDAPMKNTSPDGRLTMLRVFRALVTCVPTAVVSSTSEGLFEDACDRYELPLTIMLPIRTEEPWQLRAMFGGVASKAEFDAASFNTQFLC